MPQIQSIAQPLGCMAAALRALDKVEAKEDLLAFTHLIFKGHYGHEFREGRHHRLIAEALMDVAAGRCPRLIINVPPRYGKTELGCTFVHGLVSGPQSQSPVSASVLLGRSGAGELCGDQRYLAL
jgi:hypothetical protein